MHVKFSEGEGITENELIKKITARAQISKISFITRTKFICRHWESASTDGAYKKQRLFLPGKSFGTFIFKHDLRMLYFSGNHYFNIRYAPISNRIDELLFKNITSGYFSLAMDSK